MVTCIITTYNREVSILKRAIDSVLAQSYKDIEVIVVNDAPENKVLSVKIKDLIETYKADIILITHEENKGACAARNTGIQTSHGKYVAFLDDDDEWLPNKLEEQLKVIESTDAALVYCDSYAIYPDGTKKINHNSFPEREQALSDFEKLLIRNYIGSTSYPLIRLDVIKAIGGFAVGLKASQDHELWLRIAQKYAVVKCDKPLVNYYYSEISITSNWINRKSGFNYIWDEFYDEYLMKPNVSNMRLNEIAVQSLKCHKFKDFFVYWIKAIKIKPISGYNLLLFSKLFEKLARLQHGGD